MAKAATIIYEFIYPLFNWLIIYARDNLAIVSGTILYLWIT
jgi:hypothetical protein